MTDLDVVIRGGILVTASETFAAEIGIKDGKIAVVGAAVGDAPEVVDAKGLLVMPGGIDSHVHFAQNSSFVAGEAEPVTMADGFESGTRSAAIGGNTTVLPFCLQNRGQSLREALKAYHALAEGNCYIDTSFHLIVSDPTPQVLGQELPALVEDGYTSLKVFMTYEGLALADREILEVLAAAKAHGALVMVHCENYDVIRYMTDVLEREGKIEPYYHAASRPVIAEREATNRAVSLAELIDQPIVVVHVSNGEAIDEIRRAQSRGLKVIGETCTQYVTLTADDLKGLNMEGAKYVCSPPPRDSASQKACWNGIETGVFSLFSSDHCPFRFDKSGKLTSKGRTSFRWVPNGIPGVAARLPILFSEGVVKGRISLNQFVALSSTNHAKAYGLHPKKGSLAIGADADVAIWDPKKKTKLTTSVLRDDCDYTPYEGRDVTGWPVTTLLRGRFVMRDGELVGSKSDGAYVPRQRSPFVKKAA
jgi:dihydropyrimidinase